MRIFLLLFLILPTYIIAQVGIGTATPTHYLSLGGNTARTIGLERHSTSGSSGSSLTLLAGGAASTGSNLNGGNLILSSGITKGSGSSNIIFRTYPSGASGSADNSAAERMRITSSGNVLIGIDAETTGSKLAVKGILGILSPDNDLMAISNQTNQYFNIQTYSSKPLYINQLGNDVIFSGSDGKVAIGTTTPESSAKLDITSTTQGFLPPRMSYSQREAIISPATGLMIFCTNCGPGQPQYYDGSAWLNMIGGVGLTQPPTVGSTTAASSISKTSVTSGGNITNDFGNNITARGVCWSTSQNPTTANSTTSESGTIGSFTSNITGLTAGTTYYIRAYATNASGTSYGNQVTVKTTDYAIGESALGGIIAYLLQPSDPGYDANITHGLVATVSDISTNAQWGCIHTTTGANRTAIGTGNQNTVDISTACSTAGIAAKLCYDLNQGGYSDWYLPSKDELNKLYINRVAIGGFSSGWYWSSTESTSAAAFFQDFSNGVQSDNGKDVSSFVRAIRNF